MRDNGLTSSSLASSADGADHPVHQTRQHIPRVQAREVGSLSLHQSLEAAFSIRAISSSFPPLHYAAIAAFLFDSETLHDDPDLVACLLSTCQSLLGRLKPMTKCCWSLKMPFAIVEFLHLRSFARGNARGLLRVLPSRGLDRRYPL